MSDTVEYWLDLADYDLETARAMLSTGRYLYVGFMCHLVIEKALKACYVKVLGGSPPKTHNLKLLASQTGTDQNMPQKYVDTLNVLRPMNVQGRYPGDMVALGRSLTPQKCRSMIEGTQEMLAWIKQQLST